MTEFIIEGKCIAKQRPRMARNGHFYTPKKTHDYEKLVGFSYRAVPICRKKYYSKGIPVEVAVEIYQKIPSHFNKAKKQLALSKKIFPMSKRDIDNQLKSILDGLNGIAYDDDKQVVKVNVEKFYSDKEYAKVSIGELRL